MRNPVFRIVVPSLVALIFVVILAWPAGVRLAQGKPVGPPDVAWKSMSYEQKKTYMKTAVVPAMKPVFQTFDGKKFKTFNCQSCHGDDGAERKYKMPSNGIHPLPGTPAAFEAKLKAEPTWPKWTEFMTQKVEPGMGKLLDVPVFDPKKPVEGALSCGNCHKVEGAKAH
jgi:mono/diheme cytochrome c family protein